MTKETTKGLLGVTVAGATEGAVIGTFFPFPGSTISGGVIGGASAFGMELGRRNIAKNMAKEPVVTPSETPFSNPNTVVDVTVETTATTKRTDVEDLQPIVKSNTEQASGVPVSDLSNALASLHERTRSNVFPTWETTLNEKTTASAQDTSTYDHRPQRTS